MNLMNCGDDFIIILVFIYSAKINFDEILFFRGPPCLLQLKHGVVSRERFSALELIKEYLKNRQVDEVCHKSFDR